MDAVFGIAREAEIENAGIVDRLVGCLQPVLTILGKAAPKQHKPGKLIIIITMLCHCEIVLLYYIQSFIILYSVLSYYIEIIIYYFITLLFVIVSTVLLSITSILFYHFIALYFCVCCTCLVFYLCLCRCISCVCQLLLNEYTMHIIHICSAKIYAIFTSMSISESDFK